MPDTSLGQAQGQLTLPPPGATDESGNIPTQMVPANSGLVSPATEGLSGNMGVPGPAAPTVAGPATPEPHETVARHILDALGGANPNDKMGWAKSILAGGLAAAANVGKVPEGAGFLAGAARGAAGAQEQKQIALANQAKQQEMQLKQKADVRAEQEL